MAFTPEEARLLALMQELASRAEYVTGEAPYPGLDLADALDIVQDLQAAVDQGTDARAEAIGQAGATLACHAGCADCCDQLVGVYAAEAELIVTWLSAPEQMATRQAFLDAYPSWRAATGDRAERIMTGTAAAQRDVALEQWSARVKCAFNVEGMCSIYEVRPTPCRVCHAVDTADLCHPADGKPVAARMLHFAPLEDFVRQAMPLNLAMHHALGGPRMQPEVLCVAIHDRLVDRMR